MTTVATAIIISAISGIEPRDMIITLILVGAVLLFLESILPGMVAGFLGIGCLVAGLVLGYVNYGVQTGNLILLGVVFGLMIGTLLWIKYFPESRAAAIFVSKGTSGGLGVEKPELLGQTGVALTDLRPSGTAIINRERTDVVTEGPMIQRGTSIKVVALEGIRVVVRANLEETPSTNLT